MSDDKKERQRIANSKHYAKVSAIKKLSAKLDDLVDRMENLPKGSDARAAIQEQADAVRAELKVVDY